MYTYSNSLGAWGYDSRLNRTMIDDGICQKKGNKI